MVFLDEGAAPPAAMLTREPIPEDTEVSCWLLFLFGSCGSKFESAVNTSIQRRRRGGGVVVPTSAVQKHKACSAKVYVQK